MYHVRASVNDKMVDCVMCECRVARRPNSIRDLEVNILDRFLCYL